MSKRTDPALILTFVVTAGLCLGGLWLISQVAPSDARNQRTEIRLGRVN